MPDMMRTAVLVAASRIEVQERPRPRAGPGQVVLRVRAVGICGSDKHYFSGRRDYEDSTVYPFVLGHEYAGEVAELGPGVTGPAVGTRVTCDPDLPCGTCRSCRQNKPNICRHVKFAGSPPIEGALSEYYPVAASQCHVMPDAMSFDEAVVHEPLAIGLHIIEHLVKPQPGQSLAIIGAGPIGLCCLVAARQTQLGDIFVSDMLPNRLALAKRYGATEVFNAALGDFAEFVNERTDGGVDISVEAAGEAVAMQQAIGLTAYGGLVVLEGIADTPMIPLDLQTARRRELTIIVGRRSRHMAERAMHLIEQHAFDANAMITHRFPLEQTQRAFEITNALADNVIKAMVHP